MTNVELSLVERLRELETAWKAHVEATERANAAIPDYTKATRAEVVVYGERYRASEEAKREVYRVAQGFAMWAAERQAADQIESLLRACETALPVLVNMCGAVRLKGGKGRAQELLAEIRETLSLSTLSPARMRDINQ